ncbi:MAG: cell division protein ZapA [bacterium]|nr:cell division protein ZapA [bacterium]
MAETTLQIAGRGYALRARDGEEAHLAMLARMIEDKARQAQENAPGLTEVRTLLFAALFLADELHDLKRESAGRQQSLALDGPVLSGPVLNGPVPNGAERDRDDEPAAQAIEALAARIEKLRDRLAVPAADA